MMDAKWQKRLTESSGSLGDIWMQPRFDIDEFEELRNSKFLEQRHERNENQRLSYAVELYVYIWLLQMGWLCNTFDFCFVKVLPCHCLDYDCCS